MSVYKCIICDTLVTSARRKGLFCRKCKSFSERVRHIERRRKCANKEHFTREQELEIMKYFYQLSKGIDVIPPEFMDVRGDNIDSVLIHRCKYCGAKTSNSEYCTRCKSEGFADLHKATGRTKHRVDMPNAILLKKRAQSSMLKSSGGGFYKTYTKESYEYR